jgi:hypothetical protein
LNKSGAPSSARVLCATKVGIREANRSCPSFHFPWCYVSDIWLSGTNDMGDARMGGCGRASPDAHLSDDETVAKMGHPICSAPLHQKIANRFLTVFATLARVFS